MNRFGKPSDAVSNTAHAPPLPTGNFLVRLALPPLFLVGSAAYFMPHSYAKAAERAGVPEEWRDLRGRVDETAREVKKASQEHSGRS